MFHRLPLRLTAFLLLPLTALLGLFLATEYRKFSMEDSFRAFINAAAPIRVSELEESLESLEKAIDLHAFSESKRTEMADLFTKTRQKESLLTALFFKDALEAKESLSENDRLAAIREHLDKIGDLIPREGASFGEEEKATLRKKVGSLARDAHALGVAMEKTRRRDANALLENVRDFEEQRTLLLALSLFAGFALFFFFIGGIFHYCRRAERSGAAERYNALFLAALQSTRVGVLIRDMQRKDKPVAFINEAFTRMTGYKMEDIASGSSEFLFGWNTDPAAIVAFRRALSLQETATFDLLIYRKDGSPFWSEWHLSPVLNAQGKLTHFVSLFTDTSALRQAQEDLIQAKQMAQHASAIKTTFLAMMSHEIRTPINGILGVLKLVEETPLDAEQRHLIGIAKTSSHALHGIINDILDYAKMEAGKVEIVEEPFSLGELLANIEGLFQTIVAEKGISLQIDVDQSLPADFISDPGRIRQILLNLLSNAIKFTDQGFVRLTVLSLMSEEVCGEPALLLRFEVQDTGIGISPADQEKLFKEFSQVERSFTRRFGGTGLGLAISRRLVEMLRGEIGVESQPGKGSRFWFIVPLRIAPALTSEKKDRSETALIPQADPKRLYHILLVEDNDTNRLVAKRYLEKAGFLVEEAINGLEAVEKAKIAEFDLILMDVSMPEMDGTLATCHIRNLGGRNAQVPIIALTAHVMAGDRELCLASGMNDYLNKPIEYEDLLRKLELWLHVRLTSKPSPAASFQGESSRTQPAPYDDPDFDPKILKRMKEDLGDAAVAQITGVFLGDSANRMKAFEQTDLQTILDAAHTLKSCSANCGLLRLSRLMETLEKAATQGDKERVATLLPLVSDVYAAARTHLEAEREKYTT